MCARFEEFLCSIKSYFRNQRISFPGHHRRPRPVRQRKPLSKRAGAHLIFVLGSPMTSWYEALTYLPRLQSFLQPLRYDQYYLRPAVSMRNDDGKSSDAGHKGSTNMVLKPGMKPAQEPGPAQSSHRASGAWEPGGTHALFQKTSLANSRNPFRATPPTGPRPKSHLNMLTNAQTPSGVADNIGSMNINDAETQNWNPDNKKYYDPSAGPTRSTATAP
jgi:hypothetical protein